MAVSGSTVLVGAYADDTGAVNAGSAYLFDASTGNLLRTLNNPAPALSDYFGYAVSISGNTVVVGADQDDTGATDAGSAYIYDAATGTLLATLANPTPAVGDYLGYSVSVSGKTVVVGAPCDDGVGVDCGAAYVFDADRAPKSVDLLAASDTGVSSIDDVTSLDNSETAKELQFSVFNTIPGATVTVYADGTAIGSAQASGTTTTVTTNGTHDLADGTHSITARQTEGSNPESLDSPALSLTVDTTAPGVVEPMDDTFVELGTAQTVLNVSGVFDDVDIAPNDDGLTFSVTGNTNPDLVSASANGATLTLTYVTGQLGTAMITLRATDLIGAFRENRFAVNVIPEFIEATADDYQVNHDSTLSVGGLSGGLPGVLANDQHLAGQTLTAVQVGSGPSHGTLAGAGLGADGSFAYTPEAGWTGTDEFSYKATDGVHESDTVTVTIEVVNRAPGPVDDSYFVPHNANGFRVGDPGALTTGVLANDHDPEGDTIQATIELQAAHGTIALDTNGSFTYTASGTFVDTDTFTYRVTDALGKWNIAAVTLHAVNDPPVGHEDRYDVRHGTTLSAGIQMGDQDGVLANDSDPESDDLAATRVSDVAHGVLAFNSDGSFTYTPDDDFVGTDTFTYKVSDGRSLDELGTVEVTLVVANATPNAAADSYTMHAGTVLSGDSVLANDDDDDGNELHAVLVSGPSTGLTLYEDGYFRYEPATDFVGPVTFTYKASDGIAESVPAVVTITVTNAAPWATDVQYSLKHGTSVSDSNPGLFAYVGDADGDGLTAEQVSGPTHASSFVLNPNGSFSYTPNAAFVGTDSFQYCVNDGRQDSEAATVTIEVTNSPPVAQDNYYVISHGKLLTVTGNGVLGNDTDADDATLSAELVAAPTRGHLEYFNSNGSFSYDPYEPAGEWIGIETFKYKARDGADEAEATVTIEVVNGVPLSADDSFSVLQTDPPQQFTGNVLTNDSDPDVDDMTVEKVGPVGSGTVAGGALTLNPDGSFTYTPPEDFVGTDSFTYRANDGTTF